MKLIVCTDPRGGIMFNRRRTTSDVVVTADILREGADGRLLITPYSEKIFKTAKAEGYAPSGCEYVVDEDPIGNAGDGDTIFIEDKSAVAILKKIDIIVIYQWYEIYPYDTKLDFDPRTEGFELVQQYDFSGYNHDLVTKLVYRRKSN